MVDRDLVLRKLADLGGYQNQLLEFKGLTVKQYRDNWKKQRIVERTLQIMIETCLDIANHIVSDRGYRIPVSYADIFKVLGENNLLDKKIVDRMEKMAKFRNILVHQYEGVDPEIIIGILEKGLNDFEKFKKSILVFLEKQKTI
jgi:uncharacterized protein YutE (UPF0331/DUF86 family)